MKPYYQDDWVTIYHGDCREILFRIEPGMVIVTDQPYGTGWVRGGGAVGEFKARHEKPGWDVWSTSWTSQCNRPKRIAAFCPVAKCEEMALVLEWPCVLHYRKSNVRPGGIDREVIICSPPPPMGKSWKRLDYNGDMPLHPCQKPLNLMVWLVDMVSETGDTILDPFMGSGTTLRAVKDHLTPRSAKS